MGPIVAEIMDAMGRPETAETLRWSESPRAYEDMATDLETRLVVAVDEARKTVKATLK